MAQKDASPGTAKFGWGLSLLPAVLSSAVGWIIGDSRVSASDAAHGIYYGRIGGVIYGILCAASAFALARAVVGHSRRYRWVAVAVSLAVGIMGAIMGVLFEEYHGR